MRVFVTGGTGFVGCHLLPALLQAGHQVVAMVRPGSSRKLPTPVREHADFHPVEADLRYPETLDGIFAGCEAVIHLIGIIEEAGDDGITFEKMHVEATRRIVDLARDCGAKRFLHMSALGARDTADSMYHRTKYRAEHYVKSGGVPYTIFRPSVIFGRGDGFLTELKKNVRRNLPAIIPGAGPGTGFVQPVAVEDVVTGFVNALTNEAALGRIYEVGGPNRYSIEEVVDLIAKAKGIDPPKKIHVPATLLRPLVRLMHAIWGGFPLNEDKVIMLQEDNSCNSARFYRDFGITPKPLTVEILKEFVN